MRSSEWSSDVYSSDLRLRGLHRGEVTSTIASEVSANAEARDQDISHVLQNAIDASASDTPVHLAVARDGVCGRIDVVDHGVGMSPGFVRNGLIRPFVSSKSNGFGLDRKSVV